MPELLGFREKYKTGYAYDFAGKGGQDAQGNILVDCSQLMSLMLKDEGYDMGRLTTAGLETSEKFDEIAQDQVIPGDLVLWRAEMSYGRSPRALYHVGVVESYDHATKQGNFFGSQSSTGPASAKFGASNWSGYWPNQTKFLRPKPQYKTGGAQQPAESPAPAAKPAIDAPMAFAFPIYQENNKPYASADEIYKLLQAENSGHYLVSNHNFWHGGLHFSNLGAPQCIRSSPLRCMADGEVVAYRLNKNYVKSEFAGETYQSSTSFCLVRHKYTSPKTDDGKTNTLEFYSLYMHLLPHAEYAKPDEAISTKYRMTVGDFRARKDGDPNAEAYGKIPVGTEVEILEEKDNGEDTYAKGKITKGKVGAQRVGSEVWFVFKKNGNPYTNLRQKQIWEVVPPPLRKTPGYWQGEVTARNHKAIPLYFPPEGEAAGKLRVAQLGAECTIKFHSGKTRLLDLDGKKVSMAECTSPNKRPAGEGEVPESFWIDVNHNLKWLTVTQTDDDFDKVVVLKSAITAGEPVGFFGLNEFPTGPEGGKEQLFQAHVEIFSADANLDKFLKNEAGLKKGKQYLALPAGALGMKPPSTEGVMLDAPQIVDLDKAITYKDAAQAEWYEFPVKLGTGEKKAVLKKDQATLICQHDWEKLGFQVIKESNSNADGFVDPDDLPEFFKTLFKKIDSNNDNELSPAELKRALQDVELRDRWSRLVAQHPTEWKDTSQTPKWEKLKSLLEDSPELLALQQAQIDRLVFWDDLAAAKPEGDGVVAHFHPIAFVSAMKASASLITVDLLERVLGKAGDWFTGTGGNSTFVKNFEANYSGVYKFDKFEFVRLLNAKLEAYGITTPYQRAHFVAQCYVESARFESTLEFASGEDYDPGQHADAEANGNTEVGDGPKYRGRGLIQLTWKKNYKKYSAFSGIDYVANPDKIANSMEASIDVSCWFWRHNGGIQKKHNAQGDINVLIEHEPKNVTLVTKSINGGDNALSERVSIFNKMCAEWGI
ncbi:glycoside hydrolase family 19 protein [Pseudomonas xanthosomatis]|uniref:glycoside hydrolase family 19 protein n=1 Tax=Pseudomonas xanthosomatis TaxID=2842356 RepID=UPI0035131EF3